MNDAIEMKTAHFIEVTQKYLSFEKFEEFIKIFNSDIEIRTDYINIFFGFKNMKSYKPENIKNIQLEIENKDFKTKTYNCSLFTGKEKIRATYNFISGQCITTFEIDVEELQLLSIPNQNTRFIYNGLANSDNLDLFKTRATKNSKGKAIYSVDNTHNAKAILRKTKDVEITIDFGGPKSRPTRNIFIYIIHKLGLLNITTNLFDDVSIEFPLSELVDNGMYSDIRTARKAFNKAIDELKIISLNAKVKLNRNDAEKTYISGGDTDTHFSMMFTDGGIQRGTCYIILNKRINWSVFLLQTYALIPFNTYCRLSANSQDLFFNIFSRARQETKGHKDREITFNMSFRSIQTLLNLPSETITENDIYNFISSKIELQKDKKPEEIKQDKIIQAINKIKEELKISDNDLLSKFSNIEPLEKKDDAESEKLKDLLKLIKSQIKKNPKRDIQEPILKAIEECQNREDARKENFILTPIYDKNGNIKTFLDGYLQVTLKDVYANKIIEIANKREKYIQMEKERQERIKEEAQTRAIASKIKKETK